MESPETREMFGGIAATYVRPVRQFMTRLQDGPVSTEWLQICLPAVSMVGRSARMMGFSSLLPSLDRFESLLRDTRDANGASVDGERRKTILGAFTELATILPEAFAFQEGEDQRDAVIAQSLLRQVPDVGRVTMDKVFSAGLTTVEMLERANAYDLTQTTGVSSRLSERICATVAEYCLERDARQGCDAPGMWLEALRPILTDLENHHAAFLNCSGCADDDAAGRRAHRRSREAAVLRLNVLLAEMGEDQLVNETQRLSFENRIQRLQKFAASLNGQSPKGADLTGPNLS
ncbi:MAG: helix-hairpin-helix domain-containing protein [Proteobacteria bacterium]|nr:helix-hairpin-helix domain-containing protein [Pseudomonadota bacterium]